MKKITRTTTKGKTYNLKRPIFQAILTFNEEEMKRINKSYDELGETMKEMISITRYMKWLIMKHL